MIPKPPTRVEFLQGTLDLLILRTLLAGPAHGHAVAKHIQKTSEDLLQVETGSLYPALHRLEAKGWIEAQWGRSENNRRAKYYEMTPEGKRHFRSEESVWHAYASAVGKVLAATRLEAEGSPGGAR